MGTSADRQDTSNGANTPNFCEILTIKHLSLHEKLQLHLCLQFRLGGHNS